MAWRVSDPSDDETSGKLTMGKAEGQHNVKSSRIKNDSKINWPPRP